MTAYPSTPLHAETIAMVDAETIAVLNKADQAVAITADLIMSPAFVQQFPVKPAHIVFVSCLKAQGFESLFQAFESFAKSRFASLE